MTEYTISEKALDDLNNIWIYTAENWSVEQANRYYNLILDEIEFVAENFETTENFQFSDLFFTFDHHSYEYLCLFNKNGIISIYY